VRDVFGPGSRVMTGGGGKGVTLPDGWDKAVMEFFGVDRLLNNYGMTEMTSLIVGCDHGHYHLPPWVTLFLLDPSVDVEPGVLRRGEAVTLECPVLDHRVSQAFCLVIP